jgi:hypothetical protein
MSKNKTAPDSTRSRNGMSKNSSRVGERGAYPILRGRNMKKYLSPEEMEFLKKLCKAESFTPTFPERVMLEVFIKEKMVKSHRDGSLEVTNHGADCYIATLDNA